MVNYLQLMAGRNEKLSKYVNKKIKSHKKLSSMFPISAITSFSPKNSTNDILREMTIKIKE